MPWIAAGAAIGGALLAKKGGDDRNEAQVASAREQMEFQERMSNTAHQRQMTDMKKAGINPILSSKYGGASAPAGAQATIQDTITPAIASGQQTYKAVNEGNKIKEETEFVKEQTREMTEKVAIATHEAEIKGYEASFKLWLKEFEIEQQRVITEVMKEELKLIQRKGGRAATSAGKILGWIQEIVDAVSPFTGSAPQWRPRK